MIYPVYQLLFGQKHNDDYKPSLKLKENQVDISYKTYRTDDDSDVSAINDQQITPGIMTMTYKSKSFGVL